MARMMHIEVACFREDSYDELTFLHWSREEPDLFLLGEQEGQIAAYMIARAEGPEHRGPKTDTSHRQRADRSRRRRTQAGCLR